MALRSFADGSLFAHRHGDGQASVLALHGWGRSGADFDAVLEGRDALAVDLPGFGASPPPAAPTGAAGYARLVAPALDGCEPQVVLVGHSFGGRVALMLALAHPDRVAGLVLTGVPLLKLGPPRRPPAGYRLARALHRRGMLPESTMESLRRRRGSADYRAATGVMRDVLVTAVNETYEDRLGEVGCPVDLVWGESDAEVPPAVARRAATILEGAGVPVSLEVVPGAGHHLPLQRPDVLRAAIDGIAS